MLSSAVLLNCRTDWNNDVGEPLLHKHSPPHLPPIQTPVSVAAGLEVTGYGGGDEARKEKVANSAVN